MYRLFTLYWSGQRAMGFMDAHTRFTRIDGAAGDRPGAAAARVHRREVLRRAVAARHAGDACAPARARGRLAERMPVVLLDTGLVLEDDHADYAFAAERPHRSARGRG